MVIRVGVTGHRQEALEASGCDEQRLRIMISEALGRIRDTTEEILGRNRKIYSSEKAVIRVVSPLAEGADRLVAEEALQMGFELQSPLPFSQAVYEEDFKTAESRCRFQKLLKKAKVFVLDGSGDNRKPAYEAAGRIVLRQSDILVAIWDGKAPRDRGGTGQIVREALAAKVPVLWITASQPHSLRLLERLSDLGEAASWKGLDEPVAIRRPKEEPGLLRGIWRIFLAEEKPLRCGLLEARLREILELSSPKEVKALQRFYREDQPELRGALFYRVFCRAFVWTWNLPDTEVTPFESDRKKEWLREWNSGSADLAGEEIERHYRRPFVWSDVIADLCADRYRSSFVATYLLGALAVLAAFLGAPLVEASSLVTGFEHSHDWFKAELIFIGGILLLVGLNSWWGWHKRWIHYRLLAEGLRQMRALAPFARVTPSFEVPAHLHEEVPSPTWFNWYFRAITRDAGLVAARVDRRYLRICRRVLVSEILSQTRYHKRTAERHHHLHERLHVLSIGLFVATLLACMAHVFVAEDTLGAAGGILTFGAIVLPAFGAAIQGIIHQGEFERLARRSRAIRNRLRELLVQVRKYGHEPSFHQLGKATESFSTIQILEQVDWRSVFIAKEISLP
jgi:hypothetical protein